MIFGKGKCYESIDAYRLVCAVSKGTAYLAKVLNDVIKLIRISFIKERDCLSNNLSWERVLVWEKKRMSLTI